MDLSYPADAETFRAEGADGLLEDKMEAVREEGPGLESRQPCRRLVGSPRYPVLRIRNS